MSPRHRLFTFLLLGAGLLVGATIAEIGLRLYARTDTRLAEALRKWDPFAVLVESHGELGYRQKPNSVYAYGDGIFATSNSMSFRGPEVAVPKPGGTFRIILLGGSTTHGWGVHDDETIDAYMREMLARRYPDRAFDVVNLAFDAYDSYQVLERLRSDGIPLEPDLVIVNSGINDVRNARFPDLQDADPRTLLWQDVLTRLREARRRGGPTLWSQAKHYFYLARLPGVVRHMFSLKRDVEEAQEARVYPDAADYFERNLRRIAREAESAGVPVLFSTPPSQLEFGYTPGQKSTASYWVVDAEHTQAYRDTLSARMRTVVENLATQAPPVCYVAHPDIRPEHFRRDDVHLTPEGNRMLAADFVTAAAPFIERSLQPLR